MSLGRFFGSLPQPFGGVEAEHLALSAAHRNGSDGSGSVDLGDGLGGNLGSEGQGVARQPLGPWLVPLGGTQMDTLKQNNG